MSSLLQVPLFLVYECRYVYMYVSTDMWAQCRRIFQSRNKTRTEISFCQTSFFIWIDILSFFQMFRVVVVFVAASALAIQVMLLFYIIIVGSGEENPFVRSISFFFFAVWRKVVGGIHLNSKASKKSTFLLKMRRFHSYHYRVTYM